MKEYQRFRMKNNEPYVLIIPLGADFPNEPGAVQDHWVSTGAYHGPLSAEEELQMKEKGYSLMKYSVEFVETVVQVPQR
jgi:hypothetical protein